MFFTEYLKLYRPICFIVEKKYLEKSINYFQSHKKSDDISSQL